MKSTYYFLSVFLLLGGLLASQSLIYAQEKYPTIKPLALGSPAPFFDLPGTDGKNHTLDEYADAQVLAIIFSCNHCPTAQAYEDRMIALAKDYGDKGVAVVVISPNSPVGLSLSELGYTDLGDELEDMKLRAAYKGYNFPYLYDGDTQEVSKQYGPAATPHTFIFDEKRMLRYVGRLDDSEKPGTANAEDARHAIDEILAGKEVSNPQTRTFGCSTKWAWKNAWKQKQLEEWAKLPVELKKLNAEGLAELVANKGEKLRLINVWATWCGPCTAEFPEFIEIDRMYRERDFEFISISADSPGYEDKALKYLKKWEASNTNYIADIKKRSVLIETLDPKWQGALPYTILVEPGGKVVFRQEGMINPLALKLAIVEHKLMGRVY